MPRRRFHLPTKRWSPFNLPILPFLAPRVFKPWPYWEPRAHSRTRTISTLETSKEDANGNSVLYSPPQPSPTEEWHRNRRSGLEGISRRDDLGEQLRTWTRRFEGINSGHKDGIWKLPQFEELEHAAVGHDATYYNQLCRPSGTSLVASPNWQLTSEWFHERLAMPLINGLPVYNTTVSIRKTWHNLPRKHRLRIWQHIMIEALKDNPIMALDVLEATTFIRPLPPTLAVRDSLAYIISNFLQNRESLTQEYIIRVGATVQRLVQQSPKLYLLLSQRSIYILVATLPTIEVKRLYLALSRNHDQFLSENTLAHFVSQLAKGGETDTAFQILRKLKDLDSDFNSPKMMSICTSLLQLSNRSPDAQIPDSEMFEFMVSAGLSPNIITYTVLIQNSLLAGSRKSGWRIYDLLEESGVKPDSFVHSILLNDAKKRLDWADVRHIIDLVDKHFTMNDFIVADILHSIFYLSHNENHTATLGLREERHVQKSLDQMLRVYSRYFSFSSLSQIIPNFESDYLHWENVSPYLASGEQKVMDPSGTVLTIMITAYLREIPTLKKVREFYANFRKMVFRGDTACTQLLGSTTIWNEIIRAFGNFPKGLPDCAKLIGDMLNPPAGSQKPPFPNVDTWSTLCLVYCRAQHFRAAEKVLVMMTERGILPDRRVWNTLARGYALAQNSSMTINAIKRMEEAGFKADEYTDMTLNSVSNFGKLVLAMKESERARGDHSLIGREELGEKELEDGYRMDEEYGTEEFNEQFKLGWAERYGGEMFRGPRVDNSAM